MRFLGSARFDEEVVIEATVTNLGTTSIVTTASAFAATTGEPLLDAEIRHVCDRPGHRRPRPRCPTGRARASRPGTSRRA